MTLGSFAPLPPAPTGIAAHAAQLLEALRQRLTVEVEPSRSDLNLYHLGNNHLHRAIYERALREPGFAVIHDAVLHHFLLGALSREKYIEEFVYNYGEWTRDLAADLWSGRARSAADVRYFEYPMLRRVTERSRAVVVHNPAAARMVRDHAPAAKVIEIPLLPNCLHVADAASVLECRSRLGMSASTMVCGVFGHLRESKRLRSVIGACERAAVPLLLAGTMPSDLERALAPRLSAPWIRRVGATSDSEFRTLTSAVDVCINLRYPTAGETSGIALQTMGFGKPVVMTASAEVSRYPEDACIRIDSGLQEEANLTDVLLWLKRSRSDAREIGARAAAYVQREHSGERVAALYEEAIRAYA